ncbi:MAG: hypothetical protein KDE47_25955, partial [Caldilineaceae bacterium]|nr:hypothetical protein [Caldilineaceae bacterium]
EAGNELDVTADDTKRFKVLRCQPEAAQELLSAALIAEPAKAADTLGHIDYTHMVRSYSEFLADEGDPAAAAASLKSAEQTLRERNVLTSVLQKLESERQQYAAAK